jgi:AcrR family transcriptional regulator
MPAARRPGRRERRRAETRARLLDAALTLFIERGFAATTVEDITRAADVAKGTFFNYFPSKEHIFSAFGEMQVGKMTAALQAARSGRTDARTALAALPRQLAVEPGRSPALIRAILQAVSGSEAVRRIVSAHLLRGRAQLAALFRLAQRQGSVRADVAPGALALQFQRVGFGTMLLWAFFEGSTLERHMLAAFEQFWRGAAPAARRAAR